MSEDLFGLFRSVMLNEQTLLQSIQDSFANPIATQLQNKSFLDSKLLAHTCDSVLVQYDAEIGMYLDNLKRTKRNNYFDQLKLGILNHKPVAVVATIVVALIAIASFTEALSKLAIFFGTLLSNG